MNTTIRTQESDTAPPTAAAVLPLLLAGALSAAGTAALLVSVATGPASAIPMPDDGAEPVVVGISAPAQPRPCFLVRAHWNDVLDGPQPRC